MKNKGKIAILLCAALFVVLTFALAGCGQKNAGIDEFYAKLKETGNYEIQVIEELEAGAVVRHILVDGNKVYRSAAQGEPESYTNTADGVVYTYTKSEGVWTRDGGTSATADASFYGEGTLAQIFDGQKYKYSEEEDAYVPYDLADLAFLNGAGQSFLLKIGAKACEYDITVGVDGVLYDTVVVIKNIGLSPVVLPVIRYTVTFDSAGGTPGEVKKVDENTIATAPEVYRHGYVIAGWDRDLQLPITADTTFTAVWQPIVSEVTLDNSQNYAYEGGGISVQASYGSALPDVVPPAFPGYTLHGYFAAENGQGERYYDGAGKGITVWSGLEPQTLYGYWTPNEHTFAAANSDSTKGTIGGTAGGEMTYDTLIKVVASPEEGYIFDGWYENGVRVSVNASYTFFMPDRDVSLTARWRQI